MIYDRYGNWRDYWAGAVPEGAEPLGVVIDADDRPGVLFWMEDDSYAVGAGDVLRPVSRHEVEEAVAQSYYNGGMQ